MSIVGIETSDGDELVTIDEVAERLGRPKSTLERWRREYEDAPAAVNAEPGSRRGRHLYRLSEWRRFAGGGEG